MTLFTACLSPRAQQTSNSAAPAANTAKQSASSTSIHLTWYLRWDEKRIKELAEPIKEQFEKANPNIKIDIKNETTASANQYRIELQKMIDAGEMPDIIFPQTQDNFLLAKAGHVMALDPLIADAKLDLSAYDQPVLDLYRVDQKLYGLPLDYASTAVYYNKDLFDQAGVKYPKDDWTWDDFEQIAIQLTKDHSGSGSIDQYGVGNFTDLWPLVLASRAQQMAFDDLRTPTKFLLDTPAAIDTLQWMADLIHKKRAMALDKKKFDFAKGNIGMQLDLRSRVPIYLTNDQLRWDIAPLPRGKVSANRLDGSSFAISAHSKHPKEAWDFMQYLIAPGKPGSELLMKSQQFTSAITAYQRSAEILEQPELAGRNLAAFNQGSDYRVTRYGLLGDIGTQTNKVIDKALSGLWEQKKGNETAVSVVGDMKPKIEALLKGESY